MEENRLNKKELKKKEKILRKENKKIGVKKNHDNEDIEEKSILKYINPILIIILTVIITFILTRYFTIRKYLFSSGMSYLSTKLTIINEKLEKNYINDYDQNEMFEDAIKGYIAGLGDKYAEYYTVDEMKSEQQENSGEFSGIGIYMTINSEGKITVVGVYENSGAEEAGIKEGDIIIGAEGVKYDLSNYNEFANVLKGDDGTSVNIQILRNDEELNINVVRKTFEIKSVKSKMIDKVRIYTNKYF